MLKYKNRLTKPERNGYRSMKMKRKSSLESGDKNIIWFKKGRSDSVYYKSIGYSPEGYYAEGIGDTVKQSINSLYLWFDIMEEKLKYKPRHKYLLNYWLK